jgi:hypothetical protein
MAILSKLLRAVATAVQQHAAPVPPEFAVCSRPVLTTGFTDWFILSGASNFNVCPSCFATSISRTAYSQFFSQPSFQSPYTPVYCSFSTYWTQQAFAWTLFLGLPDLSTVYQVASVRPADGHCPDDIPATRMWYTLRDPDSGASLGGEFTICSACVSTLQIFVPRLGGHVMEASPFTCEAMCSLPANHPTTNWFLGLLCEAALAGNGVGPLNLRELVTYVRSQSAVPDSAKPPLPKRPKPPVSENTQRPMPNNTQQPVPNYTLPNRTQQPMPSNTQRTVPNYTLPNRTQQPEPNNTQQPKPNYTRQPMPNNTRQPASGHGKRPVANCAKRRAVQGQFHTSQTIPGLSVCEECYLHVVAPDVRRWSPLIKALPSSSTLSPGVASCVLYSPHMRGIWNNSVECSDLDGLRRAVQLRNEKVTELLLMINAAKVRQTMAQHEATNNKNLQGAYRVIEVIDPSKRVSLFYPEVLEWPTNGVLHNSWGCRGLTYSAIEVIRKRQKQLQ